MKINACIDIGGVMVKALWDLTVDCKHIIIKEVDESIIAVPLVPERVYVDQDPRFVQDVLAARNLEHAEAIAHTSACFYLGSLRIADALVLKPN